MCHAMCLAFLESPMQLATVAMIALLIFGRRLPPIFKNMFGPDGPGGPIRPTGVAPVTTGWWWRRTPNAKKRDNLTR